ncbi:hypothetical protein ACHAXT_009696 [Thalassiosira profunda]
MPRPSIIVAAVLLARHAEGLAVAPRPLAGSHSALGLATRLGRHNIIHAPSWRRGARASLRLGAQGDGDGDRGDIVVEEGGGPPGDDATIDAPLQPPPRQPRDASASGRNANINGDEQSIARAMMLMGTSPRRIFLSLASSTAIALAANLFGITSNLLAVLPEDFSETTGFDTYYPRGGYKRVVVRGGSSGGGVPGTASGSTKCSFLIPQDWVADTGLALAQAKRRAVPLDYSMGSDRASSGVLPDAAYGPPGRLDDRGLSNGDTNVSVIVNTDVKDFRLASLGNRPTKAAEALLSKRRRPTKLESASERRQGADGVPVYQFEYTVDRGEAVPPLRAISVVAGSARGDAFVTLTVVSVEGAWADPVAAARLRKVAESFKLV